MVQYWKKGDKARAKIVHDKDGQQKMMIEGEKYLFPGFPRGHLLLDMVSQLKHKIKTTAFNQAFAEMEKFEKDMKMNLTPPEKMSVAVREIWEVLERMEEMEVTPDMKGRMRLLKNVLCFILQEDDAYRFRAQMFLWLINQKKVKPSKADVYYARGKYWKPDRYIKVFNKIYDKYEY